MSLHEFLSNHRRDVIQRWKDELSEGLEMSSLELINHMPSFVDEITNALRLDAGLGALGPTPDESEAAAEHGSQRLRLGFSLDAVVREYGSLRDVIIETARAANVDITFREIHVVFQCVVTGIAEAVTEYSNQRDAELHRQANEHFAFIAHELRNPLSSAMAAFALLKNQGVLPEGKLASVLERGIVHCSELVNNSLQNARIASGIELRRQWISMSDLCEDAQMAAAAEADSKGLELKLSVPTDASINVDARLIRSALVNLVRNAVKYTQSGTVELRGSIHNNRVTLEIEDHCGGLPPGKVEQAFAPFVRMNAETSGFGLGLAIAKQAVDAHGGSMRVQNLPDKGCIFVLEFPVDAT